MCRTATSCWLCCTCGIGPLASQTTMPPRCHQSCRRQAQQGADGRLPGDGVATDERVMCEIVQQVRRERGAWPQDMPMCIVPPVPLLPPLRPSPRPPLLPAFAEACPHLTVYSRLPLAADGAGAATCSGARSAAAAAGPLLTRRGAALLPPMVKTTKTRTPASWRIAPRGSVSVWTVWLPGAGGASCQCNQCLCGACCE